MMELIRDAIIHAHNQGMKKEEILEITFANLSQDLQNNAIEIINSLGTDNQVFNNLPELFNYIFYLVSQNTSDEAILNQLSSNCNLEQFEFAKYALRYININRIPSVWELENIQNELNLLSLEELIKRCDGIKNFAYKEIAYRTILQHLYRAFCSRKPIKWFIDIAHSTTSDERIIKYCDRV
ncbi:MAG: DNA translocase FtsK, partial [Richelia sp. RM2_1_2]|nr:DNA translocase FtsK [Richelia sp. RM2_1_2]